MKNSLKKDNQSGVFYILLAFLALVFMGMLALIYDIGRILITTRQMQNTADSVSLAVVEGLSPEYTIVPVPALTPGIPSGFYSHGVVPTIIPGPIPANNWKESKVRAWGLLVTAPNIDYDPSSQVYDNGPNNVPGYDNTLKTMISGVARSANFDQTMDFDETVPSGVSGGPVDFLPSADSALWRKEDWATPVAGPVREPSFVSGSDVLSDPSAWIDYPGFKKTVAMSDDNTKMTVMVRRGLRCFGGPTQGLTGDLKNWYDLEGSSKWCWANAAKVTIRVEKLPFFFAKIWGAGESGAFQTTAVSDWRPSPYSCGEPKCSDYTGGVEYSALSDLDDFYQNLGNC